MRMMARSLVVAVALGLVAAAAAHAQSTSIGFKLGPGFSKMSSDEANDNLKWLTSFAGGGFINFDAGTIAFQPELTYVTKGSLWEAGSESIELRMDYVEIPILFVLSPGHGAGVRPFLYAGPALAFEAACESKVTLAGVTATVDCGDDNSDHEKLDVGIMFGGGLALPLGPGALLVDARYNFGLRNLAGDAGTMKQRMGALLVGYSVSLTN